MKVEADCALEIEVEGVEYYVECMVRGTCHYAPAILGGPPEHCSPEESECDVEGIDVYYAETLLDAAQIKDLELLNNIELAVDEEWAAERLWEEFDIMSQAEAEGE